MISVLFDGGLGWEFVVNSDLSPSQIFAWFPVLVETALGITSDQVKTFALQVWIPETYKGPADVAQLGTMWLGFIPSNLVDTLASQIKAKQSPFYTGNPDPWASLALHVNPSFSLDTVNNPSDDPGSSTSSSNSNDSKSREDAIIGVVSALGGITLLVLLYLVYRSIQQRREMAHRRLSDPPQGYMGEAPPDRDFDQDSVGGQRRRSFYFAEDSLRVYSDPTEGSGGLAPHEQHGMFRSPGESSNLLSRRPIAPSAISAPVMKENSLNF
jgi:hypothetical protein